MLRNIIFRLLSILETMIHLYLTAVQKVCDYLLLPIASLLMPVYSRYSSMLVTMEKSTNN